MGESAEKEILEGVTKIAETDVAVAKVVEPLSMYMAPEEIILLLKINFDKERSALEVTTAIKRIKENIQKTFPAIKQLYIEPEC